MNNEQVQTRWYQRDWFVILLFLFFTPLGIYWMWKHSKWKLSSKWLHTIFFGIPLLLFFLWWSFVLITWVKKGAFQGKSISEVAQEAEEPVEIYPVAWSSYTNDKLSFTISYPTEWSFLPPTNNFNNQYIDNSFSLTDTNLECNGDISIQTYLPADEMIFNELHDTSTVESITTNFGVEGEKTVGKLDPNIHLSKSKNPPYKYMCNLKGELLGQRIIFKTKTHTYVFEVQYPSKSKNTDVFLKTFDKIVKDFKITDF